MDKHRITTGKDLVPAVSRSAVYTQICSVVIEGVDFGQGNVAGVGAGGEGEAPADCEYVNYLPQIAQITQIIAMQARFTRSARITQIAMQIG